jgi:hypothetical protein
MKPGKSISRLFPLSVWDFEPEFESIYSTDSLDVIERVVKDAIDPESPYLLYSIPLMKQIIGGCWPSGPYEAGMILTRAFADLTIFLRFR